jgi:ribosomal-protein-alanine N-acetyltransferase
MILTARLNLQPISPDDCQSIHAKNSFPEVAKFNTIGIPKSIKDTEELLTPLFEKQEPEKGQQLGWTIRLKEDDSLIGELGMRLSTPKYNKGEIHYSLLPSHWNKGYATEAVKALLHYGMETLGLHRIEAGVHTQNIRSIQLLEKVGMQREGMHRGILPISGKWEDNYSYAILREDLF